MGNRPNLYHLVAIDPGITIGWAVFIFDFRAFSRPEHRLLRWLLFWDCGEFTGQEEETLSECLTLIRKCRYGAGPFVSKTDVVIEDFDLVQTIGGKQNLLSPVRNAAVLNWECPRQFGIRPVMHPRQIRTNITKNRLRAWGFGSRLRRNEFAAMQHAIVYLRRLKQQSLSRPWKLEDQQTTNARWDCACEDGKRCDIRHPR